MASNSIQGNKSQASAVEIVALIIIIVIAWWFFIKPQMSVLKAQKTELSQVKATYQDATKDQSALADLSNKLKASQTDLALVDQALPLVNRPTQVQVLLGSLVTSAGMNMVDLNFQPSATDAVAGDKNLIKKPFGSDRRLQTNTFELTVNGNMEQLKNLLQLIETNSRILDVATVNMTNDQGVVTFKLKLKAYSYVP